MKKLITLLLILSNFCLYSQIRVGGVELPKEMILKEQPLQLKGAGTRVKLWMDMYAMGLYLSQNMNDAEKIISTDASMGIRLEIISGLITPEKMEKATRDGFKNATKGDIENIKIKIDNFISVFLDNIEKEDVFEFIYSPSIGTRIYKNEKLQQTISGLAFKQALFGIWLCDKPVDKDLKEEILQQ